MTIPGIGNVLLIAAVSIPANAAAQVARDPSSSTFRNPHIAGVILEEGDHGKPITSARIVLTSMNSSQGQTGHSDTDGRFFFYDLRSGRYNLVVSAPGYLTATVGFEVGNVPMDHLRIYLKRDRETVRKVAAGDVIDAAVPPSARVDLERGRKLLEQRKHRESIRFLRAAVAKHPAYAAAWSTLGIAYIQVREVEQAHSAFRKALEIREDYGEALLGIGLVLNDLKQHAEALACLEKAREREPGDWHVYYELGRAQYHLQRIEEAEVSLRKARESNPGYGNLHLMLANVLVLREKYEEGLAEMEQFLRVAPESPLAPQVREKVRLLKAELGKP